MKPVLKVLLWIAIIALVIFLTLLIVTVIVPDFDSIGDLWNYLVTEFRSL